MGLLYRVPFLEKGTSPFRMSAAVTSSPAASCGSRCRKTPISVVVPVSRDQEGFLWPRKGYSGISTATNDDGKAFQGAGVSSHQSKLPTELGVVADGLRTRTRKSKITTPLRGVVIGHIATHLHFRNHEIGFQRPTQPAIATPRDFC
jgi:hypothetical protein